jgi:hypothetical protein
MDHQVSWDWGQPESHSMTSKGTGKTSVIAAMTECLLATGEEVASDPIPTPPSPDNSETEEEPSDPSLGPVVWIVAQSNIAVKNVAEKLVKVGIHQFKLLVSREFHFEWQV